MSNDNIKIIIGNQLIAVNRERRVFKGTKIISYICLTNTGTT